MVTRYSVLLDPGEPLPYKNKYLNDAKSDSEALHQAQKYASKKGWKIARLTKEVKETTDLIEFKHR